MVLDEQRGEFETLLLVVEYSWVHRYMNMNLVKFQTIVQLVTQLSTTFKNILIYHLYLFTSVLCGNGDVKYFATWQL